MTKQLRTLELPHAEKMQLSQKIIWNLLRSPSYNHTVPEPRDQKGTWLGNTNSGQHLVTLFHENTRYCLLCIPRSAVDYHLVKVNGRWMEWTQLEQVYKAKPLAQALK